jgi:hypothetical protein
VQVDLPGVANLNLHGVAGNDVFNVVGALPFAEMTIDGGTPSATVTANLSGATGPVTANLADTVLATDTTIAGYGSNPVTLLNVDVANLNAGSNTVSVVGTSQNDKITYTPTGATSGTFQNAGLSTVFNVTNVAGNLTVFGGSGGNADQVVVQGTQAGDLFEISQGTAVATVLANGVTALLPVQLGTNVQILTVNGLGGQNTFQVIPGAGIGPFPQDNLLVNIDGGPTGAFNTLVIGSTFGATPGPLAANQFVIVNKDAAPDSGYVRVYMALVADPDINYQHIQTVSPNGQTVTVVNGVSPINSGIAVIDQTTGLNTIDVTSTGTATATVQLGNTVSNVFTPTGPAVNVNVVSSLTVVGTSGNDLFNVTETTPAVGANYAQRRRGQRHVPDRVLHGSAPA